MRLISDVDANQIKRIFDVLRDETSIFEGMSQEDVASLQTVFKVLTFRRNDFICKKGDEIDFFGILLHGGVFASIEHNRIRSLQIGEMFGYMALSELSPQTRYKFDVIAESDGMIAILPFGEIKSESRKAPLACYKILDLAVKKSLEVFHFNVFGHDYNPAIKLTNTNSQLKKVRDTFMKNPIIKAFFKGFDRKDEKAIMSFLKTSELEPADRLVRNGTKDRSIMFVIAGQFIGFGEIGQDNLIYKEGAVIGVEEFLKNNEWPRDIICSQAAIVCKFSYDLLQDMIHHSPISAIKMMRRIVRHQCYEYVY
jgi:CRP-like cAMP-binding protein